LQGGLSCGNLDPLHDNKRFSEISIYWRWIILEGFRAKTQRGKEKKRIDGVGLKTLLANIIKAIVAPEKYGY